MCPIEPRGAGLFQPFDEEEEAVRVYVQPPKAPKTYTVTWVNFWMEPSGIGVTFMEQAMARQLTLTDYRVRDFILGLIGIGNDVYINHGEVGKALNIGRSHVSEGISRLCNMGILIRGPSLGRSNTYQFNPAMLYRGALAEGIKQRRAAISMFSAHSNSKQSKSIIRTSK